MGMTPGKWLTHTEELSEGFVEVVHSDKGLTVAECRGPFAKADAQAIIQVKPLVALVKEFVTVLEDTGDALDQRDKARALLRAMGEG